MPPRGALGGACGGDCRHHHAASASPAGAASALPSVPALSPAAYAHALAPAPPGGAGGDDWHALLPWVCELGAFDADGEMTALLDPHLSCALTANGAHGGGANAGALGAQQDALAAAGGGGDALAAGGGAGAAEGDAAWYCRHVHTTAPAEHPGGRPKTTCHHTHVRVCKPGGGAKRGASGGGSVKRGGAAADSGAGGVSAGGGGGGGGGEVEDSLAEAGASALAEEGESSGGDDAPPERKRCAPCCTLT
jgi:hypothetical protein